MLAKAAQLRDTYNVTVLPQAKKLGKQLGQLEASGFAGAAFMDKRAGDGMARFTCAGKLPAALCNSIYNKALSADLAGRALFCAS